MKKFIFAATFTCGLPFAAIAADLPLKARPLIPAPVWSWTGFYVGGHVGLVTGDVSNAGVTTAEDCYCLDPKGHLTQTLGGVHAGYNYQMNNIIVGIEADINKRFGEGVFAATRLRTLSDWDSSIRARLGVLLMPQSLVYATGGVAFGGFKTSNAIASTEINSDLMGGSRTGWTLGAGVEVALDNAWSARIEYRHTDWGSKNVTWNYQDGNGDDQSAIVSSRLTDDRVAVGLSYRLGAASQAALARSASALPVKARMPMSLTAHTWTGFYLGGHIGASAGKMNVATIVPTDEGMDSVYGGLAQVLAGLHGGYNYQLNSNFVVGVEGDINHKSGSGTLLSRVVLPTSNWDGSIRARAGVLVTAQALVYGTGGFAFGKFKTPWHEIPNQFELTGNLNPEPIELLGGSRTGWTAGGGIEYALDSNWSTRIEYRYTDWGSKGVLWSADEQVQLTQSSSKLTETRVMTGLTYRPGPSAKIGERDAVLANWAGSYVGGQVGAAAAKLKYGMFNGFEDDTEFADFTQVFAGGFVGYNYLFSSNIVLGVEGDLNAKFGSGYKIDDGLRPTSDWDGSLRARLGYAATARSLIYATGGFAFGHFSTPQSGAQERAGGSSFGPSGLVSSENAEDHIGGTRYGWTVGAGVEYAINTNWSTRIDYRYTDYGSKSTTVYPGTCSTSDCAEIYPAKLTENRIGVGVAYRFAGDAAPIRARY